MDTSVSWSGKSLFMTNGLSSKYSELVAFSGTGNSKSPVYLKCSVSSNNLIVRSSSSSPDDELDSISRLFSGSGSTKWFGFST